MKSIRILCLLCALPLSLPAQSDALASARQLVEVLDLKGSLTELLSSAKNMQRQFIYTQSGIPADQREEVVQTVFQIFDETTANLLDDNFTDTIAQVYTEVYTAEELEKLLAFYTSDLGQKFLAVESDLDQRMDAVMLPRIREAQAQLQVRIAAALQPIFEAAQAAHVHDHSGHDHTSHDDPDQDHDHANQEDHDHSSHNHDHSDHSHDHDEHSGHSH